MNNQVKRNESNIPDPNNKVVARLTTRSILTPELLGPLPLLTPNTRSVRTEDDPETQQLDPNMDVPIHEAQVEALFRSPDMADFVLPPALSEHAKGRQMVAHSLPKQTDIDRLLRQLNRKDSHSDQVSLITKRLRSCLLWQCSFQRHLSVSQIQ